MARKDFEMVFIDPEAPPKGGCPRLKPRIEKAAGMIIEYDVAVRMRDGIRIYIDVYRPEAEGKSPAA